LGGLVQRREQELPRLEQRFDKFFAKYLGGRFQEDVWLDVEAKLKEITVDPKTVSGAITLNRTLAAPTK
jgi:hypothetical protein